MDALANNVDHLLGWPRGIRSETLQYSSVPPTRLHPSMTPGVHAGDPIARRQPVALQVGHRLPRAPDDVLRVADTFCGWPNLC